MILIQSICVSGNPVTVGMSIHISSIDQISEVNMVSLGGILKKKKKKPNKLFFLSLVERHTQDNGSLESPEILGCPKKNSYSLFP